MNDNGFDEVLRARASERVRLCDKSLPFVLPFRLVGLLKIASIFERERERERAPSRLVLLICRLRPIIEPLRQ